MQLNNPGVPVLVDAVIGALVNGDSCSLSDALVGKVVFEYDEGHWHRDVDKDVRKMEALQRHGLDRIVRLRRGCPELPIHPNWRTPVVLVKTDSQSTIGMLRATATAMNLPFNPEAMTAAVLTGAEAYAEIDTRTTAMIALLTARYGKGAGPLFKVTGVKSHLLKPAFVENFDRVHAMCGKDTTRMRKFMCNSIAAALAGPDADQFFQSVERLRAMGIVGKGLDTFMCDGVASRLVGAQVDVDAFFVALGRLQAPPFGCKVPNMVTVMSNGLAAAIVGPTADAFFELLLLIKTTVCGNDVKKMCTFTTNSVAYAMADHPVAFRESLERLAREFGITNGLLVTFMSNSAMSAMLHENADVFWAALRRLGTEFGIRGQRLASFMRGGVAKFIMEDADRFFAMLKKLKADFGVVDLVSFVNNSLASAARGPESELLWKGIQRFHVALGKGGLASIMCNEVASRTSSSTWVGAVLGVLHLTSAACVRALVYKSPTVDDAPAVHERLQLLDSPKRKRFADEVCMGTYAAKRQRVSEWLAGPEGGYGLEVLGQARNGAAQGEDG